MFRILNELDRSGKIQEVILVDMSDFMIQCSDSMTQCSDSICKLVSILRRYNNWAGDGTFKVDIP